MKKGAALSFVLAPGGTTMFWVTQAGWAAAGMSDTAEINAPRRVANMLLIFVSLNQRVLLAHLHGKYEEPLAGGQATPRTCRRSAVVGWVERSETHQIPARNVMGFASLYPSYLPSTSSAARR